MVKEGSVKFRRTSKGWSEGITPHTRRRFGCRISQLLVQLLGIADAKGAGDYGSKSRYSRQMECRVMEEEAGQMEHSHRSRDSLGRLLHRRSLAPLPFHQVVLRNSSRSSHTPERLQNTNGCKR